MRRNDIKQLKNKSEADLTKELTAKREQLHKMQLEKYTKVEKNSRQAHALRDDIARILTILHVKRKEGVKKV
ncbi:50S ribosomal protein L29 [Candidatus Microgenomates bacterium]|nr:MAG: 50S ribosomal protein L29 [Candidatus Microgenomates bacterium]